MLLRISKKLNEQKLFNYKSIIISSGKNVYLFPNTYILT